MSDQTLPKPLPGIALVAYEKLRQLVVDGVPYESVEMLNALTEFQTREAQWKAMEKEHVEYRDRNCNAFLH